MKTGNTLNQRYFQYIIPIKIFLDFIHYKIFRHLHWGIIVMLLNITTTILIHYLNAEKYINYLIPWKYTLFIIAVILFAKSISLCIYKEKPNDKAWRKLIPSIWTSFGVLGTFIALYFSFQKLDPSQDANKLITNLTKDLSSAFVTSIIGIILSQFFSTVYRLQDKIEEAEKEAYKKTPEELLYNLVNNTNSILKNSNDLVKNIDGSMSTITGNFEEIMCSFVENMKIQVKTITNSASQDFKTTQKQYAEIMKSFNYQVKNTSEQSMAKMDNMMKISIQNNISSIEKITDHLEKLANQIQSKHTDRITSIDNVNNSFISSAKQTQALAEKTYTTFASQLHDNKEKLLQEQKEAYSAVLNEFTPKVDKLVKELDSSFSIVTETIKEQEQTNKLVMEAVAAQLKEASIKFDNRIGNMDHLLKFEADKIENIMKLMNGVDDNYDYIRGYQDTHNRVVALLNQFESNN